MIIAALVFEAGICRDDPNKLLTYPLRQLLFWYDLCVGWRGEVKKASEQQARKQSFSQRQFSR